MTGDRLRMLDGVQTLFSGLLRELPQTGRWTQDRRDRWIAAARAVSDLLVSTVDHVETVADGEPEHPETFCNRCGRPNLLSWHAPSPLWNAVMRRRADGIEEWGGIVCPRCFAEMAVASGVVPRSLWCLRAEPMPDLPQEETPGGRRWDPEQCLWVEPVRPEEPPE